MPVSDNNINIVAIPAFNDNYIWAMTNKKNHSVCIVDPGDSVPVLSWLDNNPFKIESILITHHHADHIGGVKQLVKDSDIPVFGPQNSPADCINRPLIEGAILDCLGLHFSVLNVPGHTMDHIAYFSVADNKHPPILFSGDTLFAGGCGRLFEGTAQKMHESLKKIAELPNDTQVYCGHEYTISNLHFALEVEPKNEDLKRRFKRDKQKIVEGNPTVPSTLGMEKLTNPFLRCEKQSIVSAVSKRTGIPSSITTEVFGALRSWKDNF